MLSIHYSYREKAMANVDTDSLVEDYLRRLEAAAGVLSSPRRAELVADIREHIDHALLEAGATDETTVRNVLERLGPPEDIAQEAAEPQPARADRAGRDGRDIAALVLCVVGLIVPFFGLLTAATSLGPVEIAFLAAWVVGAVYLVWRLITNAPRRGRGGILETASLVLLAVHGPFLPGLGWLVGYALAWLSDAWSRRDKLVVLGVTLLLSVVWLGFASIPESGWDRVINEAVLFGTAIGGLFGAAYLGWRLVARSHT